MRDNSIKKMEKEKCNVFVTKQEKMLLDSYRQLSELDRETIDILISRLMKHKQEAKYKC